MQHKIEDLIAIFNGCFSETHNTRLIVGEDEPIYLPANEQTPYHQIVFAHGYYASALHEIAHWCVAGSERRKLVDFGYWYKPDGRDRQTQAEFESVEISPQSYEWLFSVAAGFPFQVSCDNLSGDFEPDHRAFREKVRLRVLERLSAPLAERPAKLIKALQNFYHTPPIDASFFQK